MRQLLLLPLLLLAGGTLQAQTFDEWFRQKKTQKKYLVQQIAALQAYSGTLRQGYALVQQGLHAVHTIKQGDLGLHQDFFSSLHTVNPALARLEQIQEMEAWQVTLEKAFTRARSLPLLHDTEQAHLEAVRSAVLAQLRSDLEALRHTITAGEQELNDAARLERLQSIQTSMRAAVAFALGFLSDLQQLSRLREKQSAEAARLHQLHGLH